MSGENSGLPPAPIERRAMDIGVKRESSSYAVLPGVENAILDGRLGVTGGACGSRVGEGDLARWTEGGERTRLVLLEAMIGGRSLWGTMGSGGGRICSWGSDGLDGSQFGPFSFSKFAVLHRCRERSCATAFDLRLFVRFSSFLLSSASAAARCASSDNRGWVAVLVRAHVGKTYFLGAVKGLIGEEAETLGA